MYPTTLRAKIILLTCGTTLMTALVFCFLAFQWVQNGVSNSTNRALKFETELVAGSLINSLQHVMDDANYIADAILEETSPSEGASPVSLDQERMRALVAARLERDTTFQRAIVATNRGYGDQIIVNNSRVVIQAVQVPTVAEIAHSFEKGSVTIKVVRPDAVDGSMAPIVRIAVPGAGQDGRFRVAFLDLNSTSLLEQVFAQVDPIRDVTVQFGNGLVAERTGDSFGFEIFQSDSALAPDGHPPYEPLSLELRNSATEIDEALAYAVTMRTSLPKGFDTVRVALGEAGSELRSAQVQTQQQSIVVSAALLFLCFAIALLTTRMVLQPLVLMTNKLSQSRAGKIPDALPLARLDEVGDLARTFEALTRSLNQTGQTAQTILNTMVDGVVTLDQHGCIRSFNPACEELFGYSEDEVKGQNVKILMTEKDAVHHDRQIADFGSQNRTKLVAQGRWLTARRKSGDTFFIELSVSRTLINGETVLTGIVRDVTERREMEIMKDEFISTVNHELRTPLTTIRGSLGLLKQLEGSSMNGKSSRLLQLAHENTGRLTRLVNDILDMEKVALGKLDFQLELTEISELVSDVVKRHDHYATANGLTFSVLKPSEDIYCRVDPSRFNQALVNLLTNAAKFAPRGSSVQISVFSDQTDRVRISVRDEGPGIPLSFQTRIFDRFAQADSSSTRSKGGSGLGLNITKSIIEAFGGCIGFESAPGVATIFWFDLPAKTSGRLAG